MAAEWREIEPWEPEESVGKLWHAFASRLDAPGEYPEARVALNEVSGRIQVLFRGLGGSPSVELRPAADRVSQHRIGWLRRLGTEAEALPRASFDGEALRLPQSLAVFPARDANEALYLWLAASAAHAVQSLAETDVLRADLARLRAARQMIAATLDDAPGLSRLYAGLSASVLAQRPVARLKGDEAAVEELVRHILGDPADLSDRAAALWQALDGGPLNMRAGRDYKPFRPVVIWPEIEPLERSASQIAVSPDTDGAPQNAPMAPRTSRARRRESDQARRNDNLILHRFEALLSWAEFMNLNRMVDDDDEDDAKKAADDQEELGLGQISKAPATRLKLHLDLSPEDADREALAGSFTYPEWDARRSTYLPDHVRVLASRAADAAEAVVAPFSKSRGPADFSQVPVFSNAAAA